jgi:hypothetical protein
MRDWLPLIGFVFIAFIIGIVGVYKKKAEPEFVVNTVEVVKLKDKLITIKDTVTKIEYKLQKAKEIHDTITIIKQQDTLIKILKVEVKLQDTIIKKQDTIINNCEQEVKKEKRKKLLAIGSAVLLSIGLIVK